MVVPNSELMFALAETSAIFVAILAGFYTTKIISIGSDKKRLESRIHETRTEISWTSAKIDLLESKIDKEIRETEDRLLQYFIDDIKSLGFDDIKSLEELKISFEKFLKSPAVRIFARKIRGRHRTIIVRTRKTT